MGFAEVLHGLSLVLAGRKDEVPELPNPIIDPLDGIGEPQDCETHALASHQLSPSDLVRFGLNMERDKVMRPKMENRIGFLPASCVEKLRAQAEADLLECSTIHPKPSFLSNGDVLTAWGAHAMLAAEPKRTTPLMILNNLNLRNRFPASATLRPGVTRVQNLQVGAFILVSAEESSTATVGSIAARIRTSMVAQTTPGQLHATVHSLRLGGAAPRPIFGEPNSRMIISSNLDKTKIFDGLDFSPAVVHKLNEGRDGDNVGVSRRPGRLLCHFAHNPGPGDVARHLWITMGRDLDGNYWFAANMVPEAWAQLEESMRSLWRPGKFSPML